MIKILGRLQLALWTGLLFLVAPLAAHDPDYTGNFDRSRCSFTSTGSNPFFPLWPGQSVLLEGEEDDDGELVTVTNRIVVTNETEVVDGVVTRVVTEHEEEDDELVEESRNFFALCRETGDVWYFGEDVDIYEDGEIVSHDGAWRAGVDGAKPGMFIPGTPLLGSRFQQEFAPGVAEDLSEIVGVEGVANVPAGEFTGVLTVLDTNALAPSGPADLKVYAPGVGNIVDEVMEMVEFTPAPCTPDETTHCLQGGRFRVTVDWHDFAGGSGDGHAILPSDQSGEFWFFGAGNTELLVKVIDACDEPGLQGYWVFAAGLTNVEVSIVVVDTHTGGFEHTYTNPLGTDFAPVLDTTTFQTCP
ncbi:MAG: hypothetical protein AB7G12_02820 [Thermoanaerobaculia bacterium]